MSLQALLQLSDSALPTGAFSHSFGLEQYIDRGEVSGESSYAKWLHSYIENQLTYTDALAIRLLYRGEVFEELCELLHALALPAQVRAAGTAMGKRIREISVDALGVPPLPSQTPATHPCLEFGRTALHHGADVDTAVIAHLTSSVISVTQNAVRAIPIGQSAGQRVIALARPWVSRANEHSQSLDLRDLGAVTPGLEIAQMQHERLRARMFMS